MPDGGELSLSSFSANHQVVIRISDTGVGMTKKVLKQIFEPFFTTKETGKGTGLGLAMVYGIIEKQDGHISVNSTPGKGTCFEIKLPLYEGDRGHVNIQSNSTEIPNLIGHVLLVDDEDLLRELGEEILSLSGLEVLTAISGEQALAILANSDEVQPDVVLLDMNMPGIGGMATLREIRSSYDSLKVIVMTGYSETTFDSATESLCYDGFISKPYQASDLCAEVLRVLQE